MVTATRGKNANCMMSRLHPCHKLLHLDSVLRVPRAVSRTGLRRTGLTVLLIKSIFWGIRITVAVGSLPVKQIGHAQLVMADAGHNGQDCEAN